MGIRGLTTFIANRSSQYLESYELHDCNLVIDGNSLASQLYKWHCKCNDCFGGDYDKYANVIHSFFQLMSDCSITPLIVFDGAYEKRKLKTVYSRMRNKISAAKALNSVSEGRVSLFPLFLRELFVDIVQKLGVKCVRCDFEGDSDAANLARSLQCPVLSYDSDFYIFDVLYIPFSTMELRLRKKKGVSYVLCEVYKVDKFLNSFGGLDKINLPLLAVLLGNDYIKKSAFSVFYRHLKMHRTKQNEQQTQIKSVIVWLKNETPDSALRKILGRYKLHNRKRLAGRIQRAIEGYQCGSTEICSYFNINQTEQSTVISVPKPEDIEEVEEDLDDDAEEPNSSGDSPEEKQEEIDMELAEEEKEDVDMESVDQPPIPKFNIPNFFRENFRRCLYPPCFMDMIVSHTYYCIPQIEEFSSEHSHVISFDILAAIYKILTFPKTKNLICVGRNDHANIKKISVPVYEKHVPDLAELENINEETGKVILLNILNIPNTISNNFPNSWHLFLFSIKYWVTNSKSKVELPYIYSAVLCGILLNYVDDKVGFYRSTKSFLSKYSTNTDVAKPSDSAKNIIEALSEIDLNDGVSCMKKLIHYFQMDAKMKSNIKLFDRKIVHEFSQFQSCLLHIKYLNSLLNFPFPSFVISNFYDGTFLYNMTTNLLKRTDVKSYIKILLGSCPKILHTFELMMEQIEEQISANIGKHDPPRKRKKKKKVVRLVPEVNNVEMDEPDEEYAFDANNKYSLLSFINK